MVVYNLCINSPSIKLCQLSLVEINFRIWGELWVYEEEPMFSALPRLAFATMPEEWLSRSIRLELPGRMPREVHSVTAHNRNGDKLKRWRSHPLEARGSATPRCAAPFCNYLSPRFGKVVSLLTHKRAKQYRSH